MTGRRRARWCVWLLLAAVVAACGSTGEVVDAGAAPTAPDSAAADEAPTTGASPTAPLTSEPTRSTADTTRNGPASGTQPAPPEPGDEPGPRERPQPTASDVERTSVTVYLTRDGALAPVTRRVARVPRIGTAALEQLLAGPTDAEASSGYATGIPTATRLRGLTITDRIASVDLSRAFEAGGSEAALATRVGQVTCTLDTFPTVDGVVFAIDGQRVDVVTGAGTVTGDPVTCAQYR